LYFDCTKWLSAMRGSMSAGNREPGGALKSLKHDMVETIYLYVSELHEPIISANSSSM
jgi:hypothetical protein